MKMAQEAKTAERYGWDNPRPLPDAYPIRSDLTGVDLAFSTASGLLHSGGAYLDYHGGQCRLVDRKWVDLANTLFFRGGKLSDHGLKVREGLDSAAVHNTLRWLASSWEPKHEQKEATVGFLISTAFERA
jgi:hypothetical protein